MTGAGRLASPASIAQTVFSQDAWACVRIWPRKWVLVTAGSTEEPLDAVRLHQQSVERKDGVCKPCRGCPPPQCASGAGERADTRREPPIVNAFERVRDRRGNGSGSVPPRAIRHRDHHGCQAVADFRPAARSRNGENQETARPSCWVSVEPTEDILRRSFPPAAEWTRLLSDLPPRSEQVAENAAAKLRAKKLDLVVANDVSHEGAGFDVDTNVVTLLLANGRSVELEKMSKHDVANRVLDEVVEIRKSGWKLERLHQVSALG